MALKKRMFAILIASFCVFPWAEAEAAIKLRVIVAVVNIRAQASLAGEVIGQATNGTILEADSQQGEWFRVKFVPKNASAPLTGFVNVAAVQMVQSQPAPVVKPAPTAKPAVSQPQPEPPAPQPQTQPVPPPPAPAGAPSAYGSWVVGGGASIMTYWTSWEYSVLESYGRTYYHRWHIFSRTGLTGFVEKRELLKLGPLALNVKAEAHIGFLGGTNQDTQPTRTHLSDGGSTFGFDILLKLAYPIPSTSGIAVAPYFAIGPQYMIIGSNGVGSESSDGGYKKGWTENIFAIPLCFGADIDFKGFALGAEYRYVIIASASTDMELDGYETWFYTGQTGGVFHVNLGFRF